MLDLALDPSADSRFEPQKTEPWSERLPPATAGRLGQGRRGAVALVALLKQGWQQS